MIVFAMIERNMKSQVNLCRCIEGVNPATFGTYARMKMIPFGPRSAMKVYMDNGSVIFLKLVFVEVYL